MTKRFFLLLVTCFLGVALVAWAMPAVAAEKPAAAAKAPAAAAKAPAAPAGPPQYGGVLRLLELGVTLNPMSWDNADWNWKNANDTGFYLEHLLTGDLSKGPRGTKQYSFEASAWIPPSVTTGELVESWEVQKKPLALIFHVRKGVMWMDKPGVMKAREFVADDIVYSMTRIAKSPKVIPLYLEFIDHWEAKDKYTAIAWLKEWNANWGYQFGWGYYDCVQPPEMEKAGPKDWKNACGTGPYMITDYQSGSVQTYTKNPNYWGKETIGGKKYQLPFTDQVQYLIIKDDATQLAALRSGQVDMQMGINWKYVDDLKKSNPQLLWAKHLTLGGYMVSLRMDTKPFDDIRVRRALNMAVNKQEIIDTFFGGNAEMVNYPYPKIFTEVYTPFKDLPQSAKELFIYNPEKAKKLLAEAGYPNGFTFKAQISNSSQEGLDEAAMVVAYLAKVGVTLELETMDYPSYLSKMTSKTHGPGYFFSNDHGNPLATIRKNFLPGQTWNPYMMNDDYLTKGYNDAITNPNLTWAQINKKCKEMAVYAMDQAPAIWLPGSYFYSAWWPWVKNYYGELRTKAWAGQTIYSRIWIDQKMKKQMGY